MYLNNFNIPVFDMGDEPDYSGFIGNADMMPNTPNADLTNARLQQTVTNSFNPNYLGNDDPFSAQYGRMPNGVLIRQQNAVRDPQYDFDNAAMMGRSFIPQQMQQQYEAPSSGIQRMVPNMYADSYNQPGNAEEQMLNSQLGASLNKYLDMPNLGSEEEINRAIDRAAAQYNSTPATRRTIIRKQAPVSRRIPNQYYDYARNIEGAYAPTAVITAKRLSNSTPATRRRVAQKSTQVKTANTKYPGLFGAIKRTADKIDAQNRAAKQRLAQYDKTHKPATHKYRVQAPSGAKWWNPFTW